MIVGDLDVSVRSAILDHVGHVFKKIERTDDGLTLHVDQIDPSAMSGKKKWVWLKVIMALIRIHKAAAYVSLTLRREDRHKLYQALRCVYETPAPRWKASYVITAWLGGFSRFEVSSEDATDDQIDAWKRQRRSNKVSLKSFHKRHPERKPSHRARYIAKKADKPRDPLSSVKKIVKAVQA
jgi:hypothetical protein